MAQVLETIFDTFQAKGSGKYGSEAVSQLEHALQSATLAMEQHAEPWQVVAALLHDFGHIIDDRELPKSDGENLDDQHEQRAYAWLLKNFGAAVADPVRLHVAAKRYLCTIDPGYEKTLSPTSYKSFLDQGGVMDAGELAQFQAEPYYQQALQLRRWDDLAKDPLKATPPIESFVVHLQACLQPLAGR